MIITTTPTGAPFAGSRPVRSRGMAPGKRSHQYISGYDRDLQG